MLEIKSLKIKNKIGEYVENNRTKLAKLLFILGLTGAISSSGILVLLKEYKIMFINKYNIDITTILICIFSFSFYMLLVPFILMDKKTMLVKIVGLGISSIGTVLFGLVILEEKQIVLSGIMFFIVFLIFFFWTIIDFVIIIYKWLCVRKDGENTKQMDIAKLNLLWLILAFILGILFNIRKWRLANASLFSLS